MGDNNRAFALMRRMAALIHSSLISRRYNAIITWLISSVDSFSLHLVGRNIFAAGIRQLRYVFRSGSR
jgi:hypothetical protein